MVSNDKKRNAKYWMRKLAETGIGTRPFFYPLHVQPCLKKVLKTDQHSLPNSERLAMHGFYLPSGVPIAEYSLNKIVNFITKLTK